MNDRYVAGFFDGEGSALIITIRRKLERGILYQFRPTIMLAQKNPPVLHCIRKHLGYGDIQKAGSGTHKLLIKNINDCIDFSERIKRYTFIKTNRLAMIIDFCELMKNRNGNIPYSKKQILKFIDIRDRIHLENQATRSSPSLKYSREKILSEHAFVSNIKAWHINRTKRKASIRRYL